MDEHRRRGGQGEQPQGEQPQGGGQGGDGREAGKGKSGKSEKAPKASPKALLGKAMARAEKLKDRCADLEDQVRATRNTKKKKQFMLRISSGKGAWVKDPRTREK